MVNDMRSIEICERKLGWLSNRVNALRNRQWIPSLRRQESTHLEQPKNADIDRYTLRPNTAEHEKVVPFTAEANETQNKSDAPRINAIKEALKQAKKK